MVWRWRISSVLATRRRAGPSARRSAGGSPRTAPRCRTPGAIPAARSAPSRRRRTPPGTRPWCARWSRSQARVQRLPMKASMELARLVGARLRAVGQQQQHVHVGMREQLGTPVAALPPGAQLCGSCACVHSRRGGKPARKACAASCGCRAMEASGTCSLAGRPCAAVASRSDAEGRSRKGAEDGVVSMRWFQQEPCARLRARPWLAVAFTNGGRARARRQR